MAIYTVHAPPAGGTHAEDADRMVFVPERGSWIALVAAPIWILWHRLWTVFLLWLLAMVACDLVAIFADPIAGLVLAVLFTLWFALVANDARRWTLERRGWTLAGIVHAHDRDDAERHFFQKLAARLGPAARAPDPRPTAPRTVIPGGGLPPVVGFPEARA